MATTRREPLSRARILQAALGVVDREGLDALSMRRVGTELGVEAMSLYNHVPNKSALLDGLHESILDEMERPRSGGSWTTYARHQAVALRRALAAHPNAVLLFASRPASTAAALARLEEYLARVREGGFTPLRALEVVQCISAYVIGHTLWSLGPSTRSSSVAPDYGALDPGQFPNVRAAAAALDHYNAEKEFERGLDALLDGLAAKSRSSL